MEENKNISSHLTDHEFALAAEALANGSYDSLDKTIREHLETCDECRIHLMELASAIEEMESLATENGAEKVEKLRFLNPRYVAAASTILLILTAVFSIQNNFRKQEIIESLNQKTRELKDSSTQTKLIDSLKSELSDAGQAYEVKLKERDDSIQQIQKEYEEVRMAIASAYEPNNNLEEEMQLTLRSGKIDLTSPNQLEFTNNGFVNFKWKNSGIRPDLVIYNNRGMQIHRQDKVINGHKLNLSKFNFGTYYYELHNKNELGAIGKFEIR